MCNKIEINNGLAHPTYIHYSKAKEIVKFFSLLVFNVRLRKLKMVRIGNNGLKRFEQPVSCLSIRTSITQSPNFLKNRQFTNSCGRWQVPQQHCQLPF
jgi:hypothetical protein